MSSNTELIGIIETMKNVCVDMATGGEFSYEKYESERQKIMSYSEFKTLLPDWLIECRYGQQYWNFISTKLSTYAERRLFLRAQFDEMADAIRLGVTRPINLSTELSVSQVDDESVERLWRKVIERAQSDPEGAITASRSLLEAVMKFILDKEGVDYTNKDDFVELYKSVKKVLKLDPQNHNVETFKQILGGVASVVQGFGSLRNDYGDAHGKGKNSYVPEQRHAELVINLTGSLSVFIIDTYISKVKL